MGAEVLKLKMKREQMVKVAAKLEELIDKLAIQIEELEEHGHSQGGNSKAV
jgi:predicted esterase